MNKCFATPRAQLVIAALALITLHVPASFAGKVVPGEETPATQPERPPDAGADRKPPASLSELHIPAQPAPVVDLAEVLDARDEQYLTSLSMSVKQSTGAEIAVLTVRSTAPLDEFSYGMKVVETWKLGSAEKDDGLLLLIAVDDRRTRFFQGYGLEGILPDGRLGVILDTKLIPAIRSGDLPGGVRAAMNEAARIIVADRGKGVPPPADEMPPGRQPSLFVILILVVFLVFLMSAMGSRRKGIRGRRYPPIFWGGGFGAPMGGGFGGGFGGRGGGFGGFGGGGGGFGGGGAGRSW